MRTTVILDDDLATQLREVSHRLNKPFKAVLNDAIRRGLGGIGKSVAMKPFRVEPRNCRLRPGFDETRWNQLLDDLELEAAGERLRKVRRSSRTSTF